MAEYLIEHFRNLNELIKSNEARENNKVFWGKHESDDDDFNFTKTKSYAEAVELLRKGYDEPLNEIKRGVEINAKSFIAQKTAVKNDIVGYAPCVPNAILGIPKSMINKDLAVKKSKIISIVYDATASAGTSTETFIKSGITVLTIVNSLEAMGYRAELKVSFFNAFENTQNVYATVALKDWRQPLDLKKTTFPFCHPSMLRRIGFKYIETHPRLTDSGYRSGYGCPQSGRKEYNDLVNELKKNNVLGDNEKFINIKICRRKNFDAQKVAKACGLEI